MTHLDNPAAGIAINVVGWATAMSLAPFVMTAAAIMALSPRYPRKDRE